MKIRTIIWYMQLIFIWGCINKSTDSQILTIERAFHDLFQSSDVESRVTAIILAGDFKETAISEDLKNLLAKVKGVEKTAVLYSLSKSVSDDYIDQFIDSLPDDEKGINELLDIESSRKTYFSEPQLKILNYLGSLANYNDKALAKLETIHSLADGWQGDSTFELLLAAKKWRTGSGSEKQ